MGRKYTEMYIDISVGTIYFILFYFEINWFSNGAGVFVNTASIKKR